MNRSALGDYSLHDPEMLDRRSREAMAAKLLGILRAHMGAIPADVVCLDIGCSAGHITERLALACGRTLGVDVDRSAVRAASARAAAAGHGKPAYAIASGQQLPFPDGRFDVVCCNQVYQYVPSPEELLAEVRRVLKPGGVCFFSARNLWGLAYKDNWRPFLLRYAPGLAMLAPAKRNWRERSGRLLSHRELVRLADRFAVHDYTWRVMLEPGRCGFGDLARWQPLLRRVPAWVQRRLLPLIPNHLWVLEKRD